MGDLSEKSANRSSQPSLHIDGKGVYQDLVASKALIYHSTVPFTGSDFTQLERAVLDTICEKYPEDRAALESQLSTASVISRENTGAGFYTHFAVERLSSAVIGGGRLRNGPAARIDGLQHGMGFILWLKDGYVDQLEGFCYDESTVGLDFERTGFQVTKI